MTLLFEVGWGGEWQSPTTILWTDLTQRVDQTRGVVINRGAADERSETQPGTATMALDNQDGYLTPGNSASPWYPFVRKNAPVRASQAVIPTRSGAAPYPVAMLGDDFDDNQVNTTLWPSNYGGASEVGGRMRVPVNVGTTAGYQSARVWLLTGSKLTAKLATIPAANGSSSGSASMWINSTTSGTRLGWSYNPVSGNLSAASQVGFSDGGATVISYSPISHAWLRVRESGGTVYWESSGDGFGWTVRRSLATPAWVGAQTQLVEFAATRTGGSADYIEWDLVGAEVRPRFYGTINELPVDWEGLLSKVPVTCTDLFKQFGRLPDLRSMVTEEIIERLPVAYYPLTEPADSISAGDLSGSGLPSMAITQAGAGGTLTMASVEGPAATGDSAPLFTPSTATAGKYLTVDLGAAAQDRLSLNRPCFEVWFKTSTTGRAILGLYSADLQYVHVLSLSAAGALQIEWTVTGGALAVETVGGVSGLADDQWHHVVYDQHFGTVFVDGVNVDSTLAVTLGTDQRFFHIGGYRGTRLWNGAIVHAAVYASSISIGSALADHYDAGANGYAGEPADIRVERLAEYAGLLSVTIWGSTHDPIDSQGPGGSGVIARLREVEATESGKLFMERDWFGLAYQSRDVRYNPDPSSEVFTIDWADLEPGSRVSDDDQKLINLVEASRPGGATQRITSPTSIAAFGIYPRKLDLLKTSDNSVLDAANWLVSRYADQAPELREVFVDAYTHPAFLDILDADISSYFTVYNLPAQAASSSMRVTVEGYTETIKEKSHLINFHTSASATDSVWVLDDPVYSVLDSTTRLAY
ncbi:LamG-like jellyroll fold domain-containing protein [Streptomyces sp. NPDC057757]|uniref:LamG-like jellyroll fold domain-containing protein n=1 Tax=Streptomyces sp. NPDC057757 TaxID=3346241 RepID=UPI00367726AF